MTGIHMTIDTNTMVSISEANQNFSKVARLEYESLLSWVRGHQN